MDWTNIRAPWLGNHNKLPVHEPGVAVSSNAMTGRIKNKKVCLPGSPFAHLRRVSACERLRPALGFVFRLSGGGGLWIGIYCLWNPQELRPRS